MTIRKEGCLYLGIVWASLMSNTYAVTDVQIIHFLVLVF